MKVKIKVTTEKIFKSIIGILFIINLVVIYFVYGFIKSQVFDTMFMSREDLLKQSNLTVEDIDIEKFNSVIEKIEKKSNTEDVINIRNIFE